MPRKAIPAEYKNQAMRHFDAARRQLAGEYKRIRYKWLAVSLCFDAVFISWLLVGGGAQAIEAAITWAGADGVLAYSFWATLALSIHRLAVLPIAYYGGYVPARRFGIYHHSPALWFRDRLVGLLVSLLMYSALVAGGVFVVEVTGDRWWVWAGLSGWVLTVGLTLVSPVLLMPLFNKFTPLSDNSLKQRLMSLAGRAGAPVNGVFVMDMSRRTLTANAMLAGISGTRRIILGDTLLSRYPEDEIIVVMAHELAHHRLGHIQKSLALSFVALVPSFWVLDSLARWLGGGTLLSSPASLANLVAAGSVLNLIASPAANWISRYYEWQSDEFALNLTQEPGAFLRMMARISDEALSDIDPPWWVRLLYQTHPSPATRIAHALFWQARRYQEISPTSG